MALPFRLHSWIMAGAILLAVAACWIFALRFERTARAEFLAAQREDAALQTRARLRLLESELQKYRLIPTVLGEYSDVRQALQARAPMMELSDKLALLSEKTGAAAIFLLDASGRTIAASNARKPSSFVGQDYSFRPYYRLGWLKGGGEYFALGTVSRRPGLYLSRRVEGSAGPIGVIVVKVEFDSIETGWAGRGSWSFVVDQNGILLLSSDPAKRFFALHPVPPRLRGMIKRNLQFGAAPLTPIGMRIDPDGTAMLQDGSSVMTANLPAPVAGWRLYYVTPIGEGLAAVKQRVRAATVLFAALLILFGAAIAWLLARQRRTLRNRERLEREVAIRTEALGHEMEARTLADRRYRQAREELAHANRLGTMGTISAGVAHEINQPVATIRTFAENADLFLDRGTPEKARANLREIIAMTDRIGSITAQLRRYARRGVGQVGPVSLAQVLEGVRLLVGDRFRSAGVHLSLADPDPALHVLAGRVRLEQVLVNLLGNALDAVSEQVDPQVRVAVSCADEMVSIDVCDNGAGIDAAIRDDIFMPFASTKAEGLGLGLHIARDIMTEFGGALELVDDGPGTIFRMTLVKI